MAKSYYSLGRSLSRAEAIAGWCYLPFYLVLLSAGIQYLAAALHVSLTALTINIIYFSINLLFVLLVFRNFLLQRFFGSGFWNFVQAIILGFVLYYAATWAVRFALDKLAPGYTIYNNETVGELVLADRRAMSFVTIILAPIIEETLVRGLVFGSLHRTSRWLAYIVSCESVTNRFRCSVMIRAARLTASFALIVPSVQTSSVSLS